MCSLTTQRVMTGMGARLCSIRGGTGTHWAGISGQGRLQSQGLGQWRVPQLEAAQQLPEA